MKFMILTLALMVMPFMAQAQEGTPIKGMPSLATFITALVYHLEHLVI